MINLILSFLFRDDPGHVFMEDLTISIVFGLLSIAASFIYDNERFYDDDDEEPTTEKKASNITDTWQR